MIKDRQEYSRVDYNLSLKAKSGAASDGKESNKITATLSANGTLIHNEEVTFQVDGHAVFINGEQSTSGMTDIIGEVNINVTNTQSETVTITAQSKGKTATATSIFVDGEYTAELYTDIPDRIKSAEIPTKCHAYLRDSNGNQISGHIDMTITAPASFYPSHNHSLTVNSGQEFSIDIDTGVYTDATITLKSDGARDLTHVCVFY